MPSLTNGIHLALSAILAHSQAIEIIEHNVANVNTPGYRRQAPILATTTPSPAFGYESGLGAGQRGTGVTIERIKRFNLEYFDTRYRAAAAETKNWETRRDILLQLETVLAETSDAGLIPGLDAFWAGWQNLASDPTNTALRANLLDQSRALALAFNQRAQQMAQLRADQNLAIQGGVEEINALASQIASLNGEISRILSINEQPNDLLDKRDLLLDRLAELSGAVAHVQSNGEMIVSIGGHVLVTGRKALKLQAEVDPASPERMFRIVWEDGQGFTPSTGELRGLFYVRDQVIPDQIKGLNDLAAALITQVNAVHRNGYGLNGATGLDFFSGSDAATIQLNPTLQIEDIASASAPDQPGNAEIASQLAALKFTRTMNGGTATFQEFYNAQVTALGLETQRAGTNATHNGLVFKALGDQRESVAGVSLDEEAAELIKYQRAYQAAARVMTAYDELLDKIINGMGLVGR